MASLEIAFYNTYILKKLTDSSSATTSPEWAGGNPSNTPDPANDSEWWYLEEARIRGGYNNTITDLGKKAYIVEEDDESQQRTNTLIYSGIYNSRTGFNGTNVFSVAENITKSVDPANGSIQKLYAEDTNLTIFQEEKVSRALIDKDAIYSAEGGGSVTSTNLVIGQIVPYAGNYGISTNPESFAVYGYRKYFTDKRNNAVLRLSADGITEISSYGMKDWFRDNLENKTKLEGAWDIYKKKYVISLQGDESYTLSFDESIKGWVSFYTYYPEDMVSLRNNFYSLKNNKLWQHNSELAERGNFYNSGVTKSSIQFTMNAQPSLVKNFKTINYEGTNNWYMDSFVTDYEKVTDEITSFKDGEYFEAGVQQPFYAGFNQKENKYFAYLKANDTVSQTSNKYAGRVILYDVGNAGANGNQKSGAKGFYSTVTFETDTTGDFHELFAVSAEYVGSSY